MSLFVIKFVLGLLLLDLVYSKTSREIIWEEENADGYMSEEQKKALLARHNLYRSMANAKVMPALTWSDSLARGSSNAAKACDFEHTESYSHYGENIYMSRGVSPPVDYSVYKWWAEITDYNYVTWNYPPMGGVTGHYTQVVWAKTKEVGCGVRQCETVREKVKGKWVTRTGGPWWLTFCQYKPPGNYPFQDPFECDGPRESCNYQGPARGPPYEDLPIAPAACEDKADKVEWCQQGVNTFFGDKICRGEGNDIEDCCGTCRERGYPRSKRGYSKTGARKRYAESKLDQVLRIG